jgi:hypothetical protein
MPEAICAKDRRRRGLFECWQASRALDRCRKFGAESGMPFDREANPVE